jgi:hypothetical protein
VVIAMKKLFAGLDEYHIRAALPRSRRSEEQAV